MSSDQVSRMGIDGHVVRMPIRTMYDVLKPVPVRVTYIIPGDLEVTDKMDGKALISFVCGHLADVGMNMPNMLALLTRIRARFKIVEGYLKLATHYPVKVKNKTCRYRVALECHLTKTRMKAFTSVSVDYPRRIAVRLTLEVSPETELHVEEVLELLGEVYNPKQHKRVETLVEDVGVRMTTYSRVRDYLLLGNQVRGGLGYVSQRWLGVPGGLKPMPGLERPVPDI